MNAIDTNIWIYSHDKREPAKREVARRLVASLPDMVLLWQVGCEFIAAARKLEQQGFTQDDAWSAVQDMQKMAKRVLIPNVRIWVRSRDLQRRLRLHFWDGLLVAACLDAGVTRLYSEDFGDRTEIDGLEIVNPFAR